MAALWAWFCTFVLSLVGNSAPLVYILAVIALAGLGLSFLLEDKGILVKIMRTFFGIMFLVIVPALAAQMGLKGC